MRQLLIALGIVFALFANFAACRGQDPTDLPPGEKLISLEGQLWRAHWSQDGKTIVTCKSRKPKDETDVTFRRFKTVELWDAATGKLVNSLGELELPTYPAYYLSAAGGRLVINQAFYLSSGEIEVWDANRAILEHKISAERQPHPYECVALSPTGKLIAEIFSEVDNLAPKGQQQKGRIHLYDAATGKKVQTLRDEKYPQYAMFTMDGESVIVRGLYNKIRLWDIKSGKLIREAQSTVEVGSRLILSPDGKRLVIPTTKHEPLQVWSVPDLKPVDSAVNSFHTVMRVEFSPSGKRMLVTGYRDDPREKEKMKFGVMVWDVDRKKILHDWNVPSWQCGFCGEDHLGVGEPNAIMRYSISAVGIKKGQ